MSLSFKTLPGDMNLRPDSGLQQHSSRNLTWPVFSLVGGLLALFLFPFRWLLGEPAPMGQVRVRVRRRRGSDLSLRRPLH